MARTGIEKFLFSLCILLFLAGCAPPAPPPNPQGEKTPVRTPSPSRTSTAHPSPTRTLTAAPLHTPTSTVTPTRTATRTPSRTPSPTVTPTDTPLPTETFPLSVGELELLHFGIPAIGLGACSGAADTDKPQAVIVRPKVDSLRQQAYTFCMIGFPKGERLAVSLIDPHGVSVAETNYLVTDVLPAFPGRPVRYYARLGFTPDLFNEPGKWKIRAKGPSGEVEAAFTAGECRPATGTRRWPYLISIQSSTHPSRTMLDARAFAPFEAGEEIQARGACFPPETLVWLQMYRQPVNLQGDYEMVWTNPLKTGADGSFSTTVPLVRSLLRDGKGGTMILIAVTREMKEALDGVRVPITSLPFTAVEVLPLPGNQSCSQQAKFRPGDRPMVPNPLPIYSRNDLTKPDQSGRLPAGSRVEVVSGPLCKDDLPVYLVHEPRTGLAGWVSQKGLR